MPTRSPRLRFPLLAATFLLLSLATSILSAWLLAATVELGSPANTVTNESALYGNATVTLIVSVARSWRGERICSTILRAAGLTSVPHTPEPNLRFLAPPWAFNPAVHRFELAQYKNNCQFLDARGFPFPCLWSEYGADPPIHAAGSIPIKPPWPRFKGRGANPPEDAVLPYRPIWSGLALDTAIYAALWSTLILSTRAIRNARRKKHYQCPACGYDRRGLAPTVPCPECGAISSSPPPAP